MVVTVAGRVTVPSMEHPSKVLEPMLASLAGSVTLIREEHPLKALSGSEVRAVNSASSSNEVIKVLPSKALSKEVTADASSMLILPSPLVSHLARQTLSTTGSTKATNDLKVAMVPKFFHTGASL